MNFKQLLFNVLFVAVLMFCGATVSTAMPGQSVQRISVAPPEGTPFVVLSVASDQSIQLKVRKDDGNITVWVEVSPGKFASNVAGEEWLDLSASVSGTELKIYGAITGLDCSGNGQNLTGIDLGGNVGLTQLRCNGNKLTSLDLSACSLLDELDCSNNQLTSLDLSGCASLKTGYVYKNPFSTQALNYLYCSLPVRTEADNAFLYPVGAPTDPQFDVVDSNAGIARDKGWQVVYLTGEAGIYTTGIVPCGKLVPPAGVPVVTITVKENAIIRLDLLPNSEDKDVWVETAPGNFVYAKAQYSWVGTRGYTAIGTTIRVHGEIYGMQCDNNFGDVTAIDVSGCPNLATLICYSNHISSLNLSNNTKLTLLSCENNLLTSLDISKCEKLNWLDCSGNLLERLDVGANVNLGHLVCYNNSLSTGVLNGIYCAVASFGHDLGAKIIPAYSSVDKNHDQVLASNATIARDKGFEVSYGDGTSGNIPTIGNYACGTLTAVDDNECELLTIYPNPTKDEVYIKGLDKTTKVEVYNMAGVQVASCMIEPTQPMSLKGLQAGVYMLRVGGRTFKLRVNE